ncbi:MAG: hypothetical protein AUH43_05275 [Acidobacteria bacterium 13_1_40CM_65_14]|jgi:hypothetical protein|nr:MAG: hypothetical protein AUH43_05275 [Acidobacteria bacterium 13_1_40CM_65_14]
MRVGFAPAFVLAVAGLLTISCGGVTSPSQNQQETFSGTLEIGGARAFPVTISNTGEFSVKITALAPTATAFVGTRWGQGSNCELALQQNNFSTLNSPALVGAVFQKGNYCVAIFDVGVLTVAQTFTLVVSHP